MQKYIRIAIGEVTALLLLIVFAIYFIKLLAQHKF